MATRIPSRLNDVIKHILPKPQENRKRDPCQYAGADYPNTENGVNGGNESECSQSKKQTSITTVPSISLKWQNKQRPPFFILE